MPDGSTITMAHMVGDSMNDNVTLTIPRVEALILFELLIDFYREAEIPVRDNAERLALVRLGGALERVLVEPFREDYKQIMAEARQRLNEEWGTFDFSGL